MPAEGSWAVEWERQLTREAESEKGNQELEITFSSSLMTAVFAVLACERQTEGEREERIFILF